MLIDPEPGSPSLAVDAAHNPRTARLNSGRLAWAVEAFLTILGDENLCSVILFVSTPQKDFCTDMVADYDITLFVKPINRVALLSTIETVLQNRRRIRKLESELSGLKRGMEDRKVIERAKGILMKHKSISEAEAYRRIQKMSMDSRVAMRDIANKIIELAEKKMAARRQ